MTDTPLSSASTLSPSARPMGETSDPRRWWVLVATCFGLFMALLDVTIVNVALPTIGTDLKASFSDLQWVINAYSLTLAVLLVTEGRLGDIFGRKRMFIFGLGTFSLGSLLCALSAHISLGSLAPIQVLLVARVIQGIGGAAMQPLALAIITATFHGRERGTAIGIYGGVTGLSIALGPVLGGVLVESINWESIFYVNVPIGIVGMVMAALVIKESRDERATRSVDLLGMVTLTISLFCLVLALIQGNDADKGWTSPYILTLFGIAVAALLAFISSELRLKQPMVDLRLFGNRSFSAAAVAAFAMHSSLYALLFFITLYLQNYLGFAPLDAGLRLLPMSGLILVAAPLAGLLSERLGSRRLMIIGLSAIIIGVLLMARIRVQDTQGDWLVFLPAFILSGFGSGLVSSQISTVAVGTVTRNRAGMASGVSGICRQLGTAFGIAFLGAILTNQYNTAIHDNVLALHIAGMPAAQQQTTLTDIAHGLQTAGTFVGSTGLKHPPAQFAPYVHQPIFPQIQHIVQQAYINGTITIFYVAASLVATGLIAACFIRRADMVHVAADRRANKA